MEEYNDIQKDNELREQYNKELEFISNEVETSKNEVRERKSDVQLLYEFRFTNNGSGKFLFDRIKKRSHLERLGFAPGTLASKGQIKKAFHKLALIWHPDNMNKKFKFCYANKESFSKLMTDLFSLF